MKPVEADSDNALMVHRGECILGDVGRHDCRPAQPIGIASERAQQQLIVGAVEARRGQHAVRNAMAVEHGDEFFGIDVTLGRRVALRRERQVTAHHVRMAIDGDDRARHRAVMPGG